MSERLPQSLAIVVSGGTGTGKIIQGGQTLAIGVIPPEGAVYDVSGTDGGGFLLYFGDNLSGRTNMAVTAQIAGEHFVQISDATVDGTYLVRLWYEGY